MGLPLFRPSGSYNNTNNTFVMPKPPNPNPKNFEVKSISVAKRKRSIVVLEVHYPGCTTFEGNKILVFEGDLKNFVALKELDPHFTETNGLIARFPATDAGLRDALDYADIKSEEEPEDNA